MTRKLRAKIGVIGLGIIGSRVAANLRAVGHQVYVWSRSPRAEPNFLGSPVEVAGLCDLIQLFVSDDIALLEVVNTMASALGSRHIITAHATVSPEAMREAAQIVTARGARFLDTPFTGSKSAAENAQLTYYVAGQENVLQEIRPFLEATSKQIVYIGDQIGQATVVKIATNMITAATAEVLAEAMAITKAEGIELDRFQEAMENNGSFSGTIGLKLPLMIAGNYEPHFSLKHMLKDGKLALKIGEKHHLTLPVASTTTALMFGCAKRGWADEDFSVLYKNYSTTSFSETSETVPQQEELTSESSINSEVTHAFEKPTSFTTEVESSATISSEKFETKETDFIEISADQNVPLISNQPLDNNQNSIAAESNSNFSTHPDLENKNSKTVRILRSIFGSGK